MRFWVLELVGLKGVKVYIFWLLLLLELKYVGVIFGENYFKLMVCLLEWSRYILKVKDLRKILRV